MMSRTSTEHGAAQESLWHPMESSFTSLSLLPCTPPLLLLLHLAHQSPSHCSSPDRSRRPPRASEQPSADPDLFRLSRAYPPSPRTLPPATAAPTANLSSSAIPVSSVYRSVASASRPVQPLADPLILLSNHRLIHLFRLLGCISSFASDAAASN